MFTACLHKGHQWVCLNMDCDASVSLWMFVAHHVTLSVEGPWSVPAGKPHFVAVPLISSSEAVYCWKEGWVCLLSPECECWWRCCGSCGVCVLSLQAVLGCPVPRVGLGGAPVGGNLADSLRLMRTEQLQFISMAPSNQSIMTTTHAPQGDAAGFSVKSHLNKSLFSWLINTGHGFHNTATGEAQKYMAKSCTPVLYYTVWLKA